jgi:diguanylate cyclase (GGDEF)-like protein
MRPAGMTGWLTALSLAVTFGMLVLGGVILFDLRAGAWRQAEKASDNLILMLSQDIARNITLYDLSIQGVIKAQAEPALAKADPIIRYMALFDTAATADYLGSLILANAHGDVLANSESLDFEPYNIAFREHFSVHEQRSDIGLFISRPFDGRMVRDKIIVLSRRISNPDGSFAGVASGGMRIAYFRDLFDKLKLGTNGAISLLRSDGRLIMRRPFHAEDIDKDLYYASTFQTYLTAPHGHFVGTAVLDGMERLYTFHRIDNLPLYLSIAVPTDDILAEWWPKAMSIGVILIALCVTSVVLCLLFRREIQRRFVAENSLREAAGNLLVMAATDGLTGIPNRRSHEDALAQEWRRAIRNETSLGVLMIDVDCFKLFNDHYGHQMGDEVLKAVASCFSTTLRRPGDIAARYGGEEFVALLPETELAGAMNVAEAVRAAVADLAIAHVRSPNGYVTVSVGVAVARPVPGDPSAALVREADDALYQAKRSGRNRVANNGRGIDPGLDLENLSAVGCYQDG